MRCFAADNRKPIRDRAILLIEDIRKQSSGVRAVRTFLKPELQTDATEVWNLCKMRKKKVSITNDISYDYIAMYNVIDIH